MKKQESQGMDLEQELPPCPLLEVRKQRMEGQSDWLKIILQVMYY